MGSVLTSGNNLKTDQLWVSCSYLSYSILWWPFWSTVVTVGSSSACGSRRPKSELHARLWIAVLGPSRRGAERSLWSWPWLIVWKFQTSWHIHCPLETSADDDVTGFFLTRSVIYIENFIFVYFLNRKFKKLDLKNESGFVSPSRSPPGLRPLPVYVHNSVPACSRALYWAVEWPELRECKDVLISSLSTYRPS